jgi:HJR/Mrr/RecB family endonuclease
MQASEDDLNRKCDEYDLLLLKHTDLIERFLEIAERKVSVLDDYGDENWDCLPEEIKRCITKISKREPSLNVTKTKLRGRKFKNLPAFYVSECARHLLKSLDAKFRAYHQNHQEATNGVSDLGALTGTDFEVYVGKIPKEAGFESVVGTPATGDQGADLIARRNGRVIAIQAKRYVGAVGNGAVQEIVGALKFYNADEGWVVTNSTFTSAARSLAQANNVRLVDGYDLKNSRL